VLLFLLICIIFITNTQCVQSDWMAYHVYLCHGTSVCWHVKLRLQSGSVTAGLTTTRT